MGLKSWFRLFRAQTAPATVYSIVVPYIIAGGRDPATLATLFAAGHLLHYASFGHNSLMDYLMGFDKEDPNKKHHPLNTGEIDPVKASWVIHSMLFISLMGLGLIAAAMESVWPLIALMAYAAWGYAYNNGLDHLTKHSWLPISLAFGFLPLYGYLLAGSDPLMVALLFSWGFLTVLYQIAWEGNIKDLWNPVDQAPRLLSDTCGVASGRVFCIGWKSHLFLGIRLASHLLVIPIAYMVSVNNLITAVPLLLLTSYFTVMNHYLMSFGANRDKALEKMGIQEVTVFYYLLLSLLVSAPLLIAALAVYGVLYFRAMNGLLWGSKFGPKV